MLILGIETSCDETSAAVIEGSSVLSNVISCQSVHLQFGGVVPELASRAHLRKIIPIVESALSKAGKTMEEIEGFAVTNGPGLIGALLVGVNYVKGLATVLKKPFIGVNHIEGHVYSNFLGNTKIALPLLCLIVARLAYAGAWCGWRAIARSNACAASSVLSPWRRPSPKRQYASAESG